MTAPTPADDAPPPPPAAGADLHAALHAAGAEFLPWGGSGVQIPAHFDAFEAEYAALRQRVGVLALPQTGLLELRGPDVKDHLHRLCTQEINALTGGQSVRAFQLDERGCITADVFVHHGDDSTWIEGDRHDLPGLAELIVGRQFTEDFTLENITASRAAFWLVGPAAVQLLTAAADGTEARAAAGRVGTTPGTHHVLNLTDATGVTAARRDLGGLLGVVLHVPAARAAAAWAALLRAAGHEPGVDPATLDPAAAAAFAERRRASLRGRPVGWEAYNTVRIEEGVPQQHVDFGPTNLPAEVPGPHGIDAAVSFTKGCYLGQEVVARMKNLGHPKKLLVGFAVDDGDAVPAAGSPVQEAADARDPDKVIGAVTSSTASPLAGQRPIGFAVVRWGRHRPGTAVRLPAGGGRVNATVTALGGDAAGG